MKTRNQRASTTTTAISTVAIVAALIGVIAYVSVQPSSPAPTVNVTVREFAVQMSDTSLSSGAVKLAVRNAGGTEHELVAFRTNLPVDQLPMKGSRIDEKGAAITHIEPEAEDLAAGAGKTITMHLSPGRYVFVCNLAGHYQSGMRTVVTVT